MSALNSCPYRCEQELCACCELLVNRLKKLENDHVSKSELREWCEEKREARRKNGHRYYDVGFVEACSLILEKFCKGEK